MSQDRIDKLFREYCREIERMDLNDVYPRYIVLWEDDQGTAFFQNINYVQLDWATGDGAKVIEKFDRNDAAQLRQMNQDDLDDLKESFAYYMERAQS